MSKTILRNVGEGLNFDKICLRLEGDTGLPREEILSD